MENIGERRTHPMKKKCIRFLPLLLACLLLAAAFLLMFRNGETRGRGRGKA